MQEIKIFSERCDLLNMLSTVTMFVHKNPESGLMKV